MVVKNHLFRPYSLNGSFEKKKSGLNMNYDKTSVVWIGVGESARLRFLRDMNFCWDPGIFRVLGVKFSFSHSHKRKHTRGSNERYLIRTRQNKVHIFGKFCLRHSNVRTENRCKTTDMSDDDDDDDDVRPSLAKMTTSR